jgi:hypothetical protein
MGLIIMGADVVTDTSYLQVTTDSQGMAWISCQSSNSSFTTVERSASGYETARVALVPDAGSHFEAVFARLHQLASHVKIERNMNSHGNAPARKGNARHQDQYCNDAQENLIPFHNSPFSAGRFSLPPPGLGHVPARYASSIRLSCARLL